MQRSTLAMLRCPKIKKEKKCGGMLGLHSRDPGSEVSYGTLNCMQCAAEYPILEGVAILVPEVREYLLAHVKGISKHVPDEQIPDEYRDEYLEYRDAIEIEHIEEDLESERVNALYLMNHYLSVSGAKDPWWKSVPESVSPVITDLIEKYWDEGPFSVVSKWIPERAEVLELGCGVGGIYRKLEGRAASYLGVDSSFVSILIARHLNLSMPYRGELRFPGDLLFGNLSQKMEVHAQTVDPRLSGSKLDFIVGEIDAVPVVDGAFDISISLNAIDMLNEPKNLPEAQSRSLRPGGFAIQSGPYIWHEKVARGLRGRAPKITKDSASVVEWLYQKSGFEIEKSIKHIPWLFFKHLRQIEIYSVHAFKAKKVT